MNSCWRTCAVEIGPRTRVGPDAVLQRARGARLRTHASAAVPSRRPAAGPAEVEPAVARRAPGPASRSARRRARSTILGEAAEVRPRRSGRRVTPRFDLIVCDERGRTLAERRVDQVPGAVRRGHEQVARDPERPSPRSRRCAAGTSCRTAAGRSPPAVPNAARLSPVRGGRTRRPGCSRGRGRPRRRRATPFGTVTVLMLVRSGRRPRAARARSRRRSAPPRPVRRSPVASEASRGRRRQAAVAVSGPARTPARAAPACVAPLGGRRGSVRESHARNRSRSRSLIPGSPPGRLLRDPRATGDARGGSAIGPCRRERRSRSRCRRTERPAHAKSSSASRSVSARARAARPRAVVPSPRRRVAARGRSARSARRRFGARVGAEPPALGAPVPVDEVGRDPVEPRARVGAIELEPRRGPRTPRRRRWRPTSSATSRPSRRAVNA